VKARRLSSSLSPAVTVAAVVAALCCIGLSAVTALVSSVGAGFLLRDTTLRPLLLVVLGLTVGASVWTMRRHGNPLPLLFTTACAGALYLLIFGPRRSHAATDHMHDAMSTSVHSTLGGARGVFVYVAIAALVGTQVWDAMMVRRRRRASEKIPS
jgi:hypothetical protein